MCRLLPLEGPEFLVRWTVGEDTWENFDSLTATADGLAELRDYYIRTMPEDIWQDALDKRQYEAIDMVAEFEKLKRLLPANDHRITAQYDRVGRSMRNMSLLTETAASIAAQNKIIRWRIHQYIAVAGVLADLPTGEYFKTYEEFKEASCKAWIAEQDSKTSSALRENKRQERVKALSANPANATDAAPVR